MMNLDPRHPVTERVKAYRAMLFDRWVAAKREAAQSDDIADHQAVAEAYTQFKAFHLIDLNTGARRFTAPVQLPDMSLGQRTCRIAGEVAWSAPRRFDYLVSFTLLVQDW